MACRKALYIFVATLTFLFALPQCAAAGASSLLTGTVSEHIAEGESGCRESPLGSLAADALSEYCGADVAFVPAKYICGWLPVGELTGEAVAAAFSENAEIQIYTVDESTLRQLLEISVAHIQIGPDDKIDADTSDYSGFLQISGFRFCYDASAPVGQRVLETETGKEWPLVLACPPLSPEYEALLPEGARCDVGLIDCVCAYIADNSPVSAPKADRIEVIGVIESTIYSRYLPWELLAICVFLAASAHFIYRRHNEPEEF